MLLSEKIGWYYSINTLVQPRIKIKVTVVLN